MALLLAAAWLAFGRRRAWEPPATAVAPPPAPPPQAAMTVAEFDARVRPFAAALDRLAAALEAVATDGAPPRTPLRLVRGGKA